MNPGDAIGTVRGPGTFVQMAKMGGHNVRIVVLEGVYNTGGVVVIATVAEPDPKPSKKVEKPHVPDFGEMLLREMFDTPRYFEDYEQPEDKPIPGELYSMISINVTPLFDADEFVLNHDAASEEREIRDLVKQLTASGKFVETGEHISYGHVKGQPILRYVRP